MLSTTRNYCRKEIFIRFKWYFKVLTGLYIENIFDAHWQNKPFLNLKCFFLWYTFTQIT